jgi:hypothetical protein
MDEAALSKAPRFDLRESDQKRSHSPAMAIVPSDRSAARF